eukprot:TRINITY_DN25590_c0_g1_i1.p1 TRINITY_DN25590_c0_g1~~TRINITY_DN25590_c0_g1_i1.p1  ORF type:complete len:434 (-),score=25.11 TRINITY_DN25590_c0_g1_i1:138-1439(-)
MVRLLWIMALYVLISLRLATRKNYEMNVLPTGGSVDLVWIRGTYAHNASGYSCSGEFIHLSFNVSLQDCAIMVAGACLEEECWFTHEVTPISRVCRKQGLGRIFSSSVGSTCELARWPGRDLYRMQLTTSEDGLQLSSELPSLYYLQMIRLSAAIYVSEGVGSFYKSITLERKSFKMLGVELVDFVDVPLPHNFAQTNSFIGLYRRESTKQCYVVFQGTNNMDDIKTDALVYHTKKCGGSIHGGTWKTLSHMINFKKWDRMIPFLKNNCSTVDTVGHSLGGMLASLLIACYNNDDNDELELRGVNFQGAYNVGGGAFSHWGLKNKNASNGCFKGHRFFNSDVVAADPIPQIGQVFFYSHPHMPATRLKMMSRQLFTEHHECGKDPPSAGTRRLYRPDPLMHFPQMYAGRMALLISQDLAKQNQSMGSLDQETC